MEASDRQTVRFGSMQLDVEVLDNVHVDDVVRQARQIRDDDRLALLRHRPAGTPNDRASGPSLVDLESLVESVGDCAAVPLAVAGAAGMSSLLVAAPFPCLIGNPTRVIAVADRAGVRRVAICRSRPTRTDFRQLVVRWCGPDDDETPEQVLERLGTPDEHESVAAYMLGEALAKSHRNGILLGDTRRSRFALSPDGIVKIPRHDARFLYGPPAPAQCATDLVPLLDSLSAPEWRAFRLSYLRGWPDGRRVIDLIEFADTTGWMLPFARRQFADAAARLPAEITACAPDDALGRLALSASLAYAHSMLDRHAEACAGADASVAAAAGIAPELLPILRLHAGLAQLRAGQPEAAARILVTLLAGARTPTLKSLAARALRVAYAAPGEQLQPPTDDLPFFARCGQQIKLIELFTKDRQ